jgi:hypothetical protein
MNEQQQSQLNTLVTNQAVLLTNVQHIRELIEKQDGRVGEIEKKISGMDERIISGEKDDIKNKAWLSGVAAGIGAVAAFGLESVMKFLKGLN